MASGVRVVRGPDWRSDDEDGGRGHVGTVRRQREAQGFMTVLWDNGNHGSYRVGADGAYDLRVLDNGPAGVKHKGVGCDSCDERKLRGIRWKCDDCFDCDLCTECYGQNAHDVSHSFKRLDTPSSDGTVVEPRNLTERVESYGLFPGAKVERVDEDDDPLCDRRGDVTRVGYGSGGRAAVEIQWYNKLSPQGYPTSGKGALKIKVVAPTTGWNYYPEHLPQLDENEACVVSDEDDDSDDESSGDMLSSLLGAAAKAAKKKTSGLLSTLLAGDDTVGGLMKHLGSDDVLSTLLADDDDDDDDDDAIGGTTKMLKQLRSDKEVSRLFKIGNLVYVKSSLSLLKKQQKSHGGWHDDMTKILGEVGIMRDKDSDSDLKVYFAHHLWCLNPKALHVVDMINDISTSGTAVPKKLTAGLVVQLCNDADTLQNSLPSHCSWNVRMKNALGKYGIVIGIGVHDNPEVCFGADIWTLPPSVLTCPVINIPVRAQETEEIEEIEAEGDYKFTAGDIVRVAVTAERADKLQDGHGGWVKDMAKHIGSRGLVDKVDSDGDVRVDYGARFWVWNPASLKVDDKLTKLIKDAAENSSHDYLLKNTNNKAFKVGDLVVLVNDEDKVRISQKDHGEWLNAMKKYLGKAGIVKKTKGRKIQVCFGEPTWWCNQINLRLVEEEHTSSDEIGQILPASPQPKPDIDGLEIKLKPGDIVRLWHNISTLMFFQYGHGGWNDKMEKVAGRTGIVTDTDADGDVYVCFGYKDNSWCLNRILLEPFCDRDAQAGRAVTKADNRHNPYEQGSIVKMSSNQEAAQKLQVRHGGWNNVMHSVLGQCGIVCDADKKNIITVCFGSDTWHINGALLTPWVMVATGDNKQAEGRSTTKPDTRDMCDSTIRAQDEQRPSTEVHTPTLREQDGRRPSTEVPTPPPREQDGRRPSIDVHTPPLREQDGQRSSTEVHISPPREQHDQISSTKIHISPSGEQNDQTPASTRDTSSMTEHDAYGTRANAMHDSTPPVRPTTECSSHVEAPGVGNLNIFQNLLDNCLTIDDAIAILVKDKLTMDQDGAHSSPAGGVVQNFFIITSPPPVPGDKPNGQKHKRRTRPSNKNRQSDSNQQSNRDDDSEDRKLNQPVVANNEYQDDDSPFFMSLHSDGP